MCLHRLGRDTRARMMWLTKAACVGEDPELFFPVGSTGPALEDVAAAKRVCARCPVIADCLAYALAGGQTTGVWGGTDEAERADLLRATGGRRTRAAARRAAA